MKRLAWIGILCLAAGTVRAQNPAMTQPAAVNSVEAPSVKRAKTNLNVMNHDAEQRLNDIMQRREELYSQLQNGTGRSDAKGVMDAIRELEDAQEKASIAAHAKQVRAALIQKKIYEISRDIGNRVADDQLTKELEKIVTMKERGSNGQEVETTMTGVAEARMRLLQRREAIVTTVYGETLQVLNKELVEVSLDADEQSVLAQDMEKRLVTLRKARPICDAISNCDEEVSHLRAESERLHAQEQELELQEK